MPTAAPTWKELCERSVRRFGSAGAACYPYLRLNPFQSAPLVRTHLGEARVLAVVIEGGFERVEVILEAEFDRWKWDRSNPPARVRRLAPRQILPPIAPPPKWQK